jgi:hypothetical protein
MRSLQDVIPVGQDFGYSFLYLQRARKPNGPLALRLPWQSLHYRERVGHADDSLQQVHHQRRTILLLASYASFLWYRVSFHFDY